MAILVTGGAGFIGSHTVLLLLQNGFDVVVIDNLSNSSIEALKRVENIAQKKVNFYQGDISDELLLKDIFTTENIEAVIHFAALKSVSESNAFPLKYYVNNISGSLSLIEMMQQYGINKFIFSSSATVYGASNSVPNMESQPIGETTNPYGTSKYMMEKILEDIHHSNKEFSVLSLRYFNPTGAHESGEIGEDPNGVPSNLVPYVAQVASKKLPKVLVYGNDYPTRDGTGIRDYIHVMDLAMGHVKAVAYILKEPSNHTVLNLGSGKGYSVLEVINNFMSIANLNIPYEITSRRAGDLVESWADVTLAKKMLDWEPTKTLQEMLEDVWRWQSKNPNGYISAE